MSSRRVLVVGRDYFFYTREIVKELHEAFGADVTFVPIVPESGWFSALKRWPSLARRWLKRFHKRTLGRLAGHRFDRVLFIQCHQLERELLQAYRAAFDGARFTLYYWDSLCTHDYRRDLDLFDETFSFDPADVAADSRLRLLPLFFSERFRSLRTRQVFRHDLVFVGTVMSLRRYDLVESFRHWARVHDVRFHDYLYVSPAFYLRMLLRGRRLRGVHFRTLRATELFKSYDDARAILDLPDNIQSGLTMRTFESLGAHRKLVTTQRGVVQEAFFDIDSVFVIGLHGEFPSLEFLRNPSPQSSAIDAHSLRAWLSVLTGWSLPASTAQTPTDPTDR